MFLPYNIYFQAESYKKAFLAYTGALRGSKERKRLKKYKVNALEELKTLCLRHNIPITFVLNEVRKRDDF